MECQSQFSIQLRLSIVYQCFFRLSSSTIVFYELSLKTRNLALAWLFLSQKQFSNITFLLKTIIDKKVYNYFQVSSMSLFSKLHSFLFGSRQQERPVVPQRPINMSQPPSRQVVAQQPPVQVIPQPPPKPVVAQQPPAQVIPQPPPNPAMITIKIKIVNSEKKTATVSRNMTGRQLKQHIFDHLSQELQPGTMSIQYKGTKITNNMKLGELNIVVGQHLQIVQQKAPLNEVVSAIVDANGIDPLTDEIGTAKMSCGHSIGKDTMTQLIKSLIESNKYEIRCPNDKEDDEPCRALWDFALCKKIGVLTLAEVETFQNGLSQNWLKENAKTCPKCKSSISKHNLTSNRVVCPKCKFGDFCFLCLKKWNKGSNEFCGNEQCKFLDEYLSNSPWTTIFKLTDKADGNKKKDFKAPKHRACVHCFSMIEYIKGCKHMQCGRCKKFFCWICLAKSVNGNYPCGDTFDYCGKTAQAQRFSDK